MPPSRRFSTLALVFPLVAAATLGVGMAADDPNPAKAEAELKAVRSQIDKVKAEMERDAGRRDQLTKELEESERTVGAARGELDKLRRERATHTARRSELAAERRTEESALAQDREALAGQIRAASMIGRQEPIKLLLNQRDPGQTGRVLVYYQYFGHARASQIAAIDAHLAEINELDAELAAEEQRLLSLEQQQRGEVTRLQSARERRGKALVSLDAESQEPRQGARSPQGPAGRTREAGARAAARAGAHREISHRQQGCVREAARQARLAGGGQAGRLVRSGSRRRHEVGWRVVGRRAGHAGAGGLPRPRGVRRLAVGPGPADHHRSRRRLSQPLRPQRAPVQGSGRAGHRRRHHRHRSGTPAADRGPSCTSKSARRASPSIRGRGSRLQALEKWCRGKKTPTASTK